MGNPEQTAREEIDRPLTAAGWDVCDASAAKIHGSLGVAIREFPLKSGHGLAGYLLYIDGKAAGVLEAKKVGSTLKGVEAQSDKYTKGLPEGLPAWHDPLPFAYESAGAETQFTNGLDLEPHSGPDFGCIGTRPMRLVAASRPAVCRTSRVGAPSKALEKES